MNPRPCGKDPPVTQALYVRLPSTRPPFLLMITLSLLGTASMSFRHCSGVTLRRTFVFKDIDSKLLAGPNPAKITKLPAKKTNKKINTWKCKNQGTPKDFKRAPKCAKFRVRQNQFLTKQWMVKTHDTADNCDKRRALRQIFPRTLYNIIGILKSLIVAVKNHQQHQ